MATIRGQQAATGGSFGSSVKQGVSKFTGALKPKSTEKEVADEVSLSGPGKPSAQLHVAVAKLYEQSGKIAEAEREYKEALKLTPNHLGALLGYAQLKERAGESEEANKLYQQAVKAHPNEAAAFNNQGTYYGRRDMFKEAHAALSRAVQLQPKEPKYRNNLAIVLVDMGRPGEALTHLRAVSPEAVAQYNLGFLLTKKGQAQAAAQRFTLALQADPTLIPARTMLDRLAVPPTQPQQARLPLRQAQTPPGPVAPPIRIGSNPPRAQQQFAPALSPPTQPSPARQLPPPPKDLGNSIGNGARGRVDLPSRGASPNLSNVVSPRRLPPTAGDAALAPEAAPLPPGDDRPAAGPQPALGPALGPSRGY